MRHPITLLPTTCPRCGSGPRDASGFACLICGWEALLDFLTPRIVDAMHQSVQGWVCGKGSQRTTYYLHPHLADARTWKWEVQVSERSPRGVAHTNYITVQAALRCHAELSTILAWHPVDQRKPGQPSLVVNAFWTQCIEPLPGATPLPPSAPLR